MSEQDPITPSDFTPQFSTAAHMASVWNLSLAVVEEGLRKMGAKPAYYANGLAFFGDNTIGQLYCDLGNRGAIEHEIIEFVAPVTFTNLGEPAKR